ncbi:hypothetical protein [Ruegeria sp. EL01]|uniref:hypothetical protein n=1 Tax=Ruegeria sp. EL01 TaxID=2107578 RepID=UPI000EA83248|nr:hypothetical protein [Ruegeria sp. EL01]
MIDQSPANLPTTCAGSTFFCSPQPVLDFLSLVLHNYRDTGLRAILAGVRENGRLLTIPISGLEMVA